MNSPEVQIFLLTYNRPRLIQRAIDSILAQRFQNYDLIISDNSQNDETELVVSRYRTSRLKYVRRNPSLAPIEHFNVVLGEVVARYFMMFHDDDEMHPLLIETLFNELEKNPVLVAVGANAFMRRELVRREKLFMTRTNHDVLLNNRNDVALQYLKRKSIVPFPSYMYRRIVAERLRLDYSQGGKYCDVSFIISVADLGKILFKAKPLLYFYVHKGQDSQINNYWQRINLIKYITATTKYNKKHKLIRKYRAANLYGELRTKFLKKEKFRYGRRLSNTYLIILKYSPFNKFPKLVYRTVCSVVVKAVKDNIIRICKIKEEDRKK